MVENALALRQEIARLNRELKAASEGQQRLLRLLIGICWSSGRNLFVPLTALKVNGTLRSEEIVLNGQRGVGIRFEPASHVLGPDGRPVPVLVQPSEATQ